LPPARLSATQLLVAGLARPAQAELRVEILRAGAWASDPSGDRPDPALRDDTLSGVQLLSPPRYTGEGPAVEARYCTGFGLTFRLEGIPAGETPVMLVRNLHPRLTRPDGASATEDVFEMHAGPGALWTGFMFAEDWSLVPGEWVFTLSVQGRELARQAFSVRRASDPGSPEANGCARLTS
jgi:hypothetical protein